MVGLYSKGIVRWVSLLLFVVASIGLTVSLWKYPEENDFSVFTTTISFLGSPDASRNPEGYIWYRTGMTALVFLLSLLVGQRHRNIRPRAGGGLNIPTAFYGIGMFLILASVWIPDSREIYWGTIRTGSLHTRIAIISVFITLIAVISDAVVLKLSKFRSRSFWVIRIFMVLWITAVISLATWEWKCGQDPSLEHWPGDGIHSTPLWEWILFFYLIGYLYWISRSLTVQEGFD